MATCPNCDSIVLLDREPRIGDWVTCQECEIDLEVTNVDPLEFEVRLGDLDEEWEDEELYWGEEEDFDWDEDEWDDEFDDFADEAAFDRDF